MFILIYNVAYTSLASTGPFLSPFPFWPGGHRRQNTEGAFGNVAKGKRDRNVSWQNSAKRGPIRALQMIRIQRLRPLPGPMEAEAKEMCSPKGEGNPGIKGVQGSNREGRGLAMEDTQESRAKANVGAGDCSPSYRLSCPTARGRAGVVQP